MRESKSENKGLKQSCDHYGMMYSSFKEIYMLESQALKQNKQNWKPTKVWSISTIIHDEAFIKHPLTLCGANFHRTIWAFKANSTISTILVWDVSYNCRTLNDLLPDLMLNFVFTEFYELPMKSVPTPTPLLDHRLNRVLAEMKVMGTIHNHSKEKKDLLCLHAQKQANTNCSMKPDRPDFIV